MISLENVTKRYGSSQALNGISFEVKRGQIVGFLGPNGAGKTTTMKILTGYIAPTSGRVTVDGLDILADSLEIRKKIGYLPENAPVYQDMRVVEYLDFVGQVRGLKGSALASRRDTVIQLTGLEDVLAKDISELSKGYRQRVGLAQALIHDPPILILDEPTSGLDPNQIVEIRDVIKRIGQEKTVMLSTHILSEVQATTDRVIIVAKGAIVADGTTEDLQARQRGSRVTAKLEAPAGVSRDQMVGRLKALPGVLTVQDAGSESELIHGFNIDTDSKVERDIRRALFQLAVKENWMLLELRREEQSLEAIFQTLTRSPAEVAR